MTIEEAIKEYGDLEDFYKENEDDTMFWTGPVNVQKGVFLFTFDRKNIYDFFTDFPDKLNDEEIKIFCNENKSLINHFVSFKKKVEARGIIL